MLVIYVHGIPFTEYYSHHGHLMRLSCIFQLYFLWLEYPAYCYSRFHWRRVNNKPVHHHFKFNWCLQFNPQHICLVTTWYESNSAFQCLDVPAIFFLLFIMHINNETRDFLGAKQNHMCCENSKGFENSSKQGTYNNSIPNKSAIIYFLRSTYNITNLQSTQTC